MFHHWLWLFRRTPLRRALVLSAVMASLLSSALALPAAALLKQATDTLLPHNQYRETLWVGLGVIALRAAAALLAVVSKLQLVSSTVELLARVRLDVQDKILCLPRGEYQRLGPTALQDLMLSQVDRLEHGLSALSGQVIPGLAAGLALGTVLAYLNLRLFGLMLLVWPVTWVANEVARFKATRLTRRFLLQTREVNHHFRWLTESLDLVHTSSAEEFEEQRGRTAVLDVRNASRSIQVTSTSMVQLQQLLLTVISLVLLMAGGYEVSQKLMTPGQLLAYFAVIGMLNTALRDLATGLYTLSLASVSLEMVRTFLARETPGPYGNRGTSGRRLTLESELTFHSVSFSYPDSPALLNCVDWSLQRGQSCALLGINGAGKSTMLALLLGWYRPATGSLSADDVPYAELDLFHLRRQIGVVPQEPVLWPGSLRDNLLYGGHQASDQQLWDTLQSVDLADWVRSLPDGLEAVVGERGCFLSGGQRQRVAIARALVQQPNFLVFDEPSNHLDRRSMATLLRTLEALPQRPAVLLITHDEALAGHAAQQWRVEAGEMRRLETIQSS